MISLGIFNTGLDESAIYEKIEVKTTHLVSRYFSTGFDETAIYVKAMAKELQLGGL